MADIFREAPFGQVVRLLSGNKLFQYPEEKSDFKCPHAYTGENGTTHHLSTVNEEKTEAIEQTETKDIPVVPTSTRVEEAEEQDLEKVETSSTSGYSGNDVNRTATLGLQRTATLAFTPERFAVEQALAVEKTKSRAILPARTADNTILVDWLVYCL